MQIEMKRGWFVKLADLEHNFKKTNVLKISNKDMDIMFINKQQNHKRLFHTYLDRGYFIIIKKIFNI